MRQGKVFERHGGDVAPAAAHGRTCGEAARNSGRVVSAAARCSIEVRPPLVSVQLADPVPMDGQYHRPIGRPLKADAELAHA